MKQKQETDPEQETDLDQKTSSEQCSEQPAQ